MARILVRQRDIVLVPFPFSDQSGKKVRPVVVVSNDTYNSSSDDVLVVGVTSNMTRDAYSTLLSDDDLVEGKLLTRCVAKVENILKIDKDIMIKRIGQINRKKLGSIREILVRLVSEDAQKSF